MQSKWKIGVRKLLLKRDAISRLKNGERSVTYTVMLGLLKVAYLQFMILLCWQKKHRAQSEKKVSVYQDYHSPIRIDSFIHSIGMCIVRQFLAVLRSFFHSSLLYTLSFHPIPPVSHPPLLYLAIYYLVYLSASLFPSLYIICFWEFYFLPFSVHVQTKVIYLTLLSLL